MPRFEMTYLLNFGKLMAFLKLDAGVGRSAASGSNSLDGPGKAASPKSAPGLREVRSRKEVRNERVSGASASGKPGPMDGGGVRRVQVGCGPHNAIVGWWNTDIRSFPGIDAVMDATQPWPYSGLEYVYGEHFLEHLTLDGALRFLEHAGNSLGSGGRIRLSTPNLEWVLLTHYASGAEPEETLNGTMRINRAFHGWGHQFLYSRVMLEYLLTELGFRDVAFFSYGESDTPALANLERHGGFSVYEGQPSVIIAEASRGDAPIAPSQELVDWIKSDYLRYARPGAH